MESSIGQTKIGMGKMESNHNHIKLLELVPADASVARHVELSPPSKGVVEVIDSGRSNSNNNYTAGMLHTKDYGKNKVEEQDDNSFNNSTPNSNNTTDIVTVDIDINIKPYIVRDDNDHGNNTLNRRTT